MVLPGTDAPRAIRRSGDDSPASSVWGFVWRMTGRAQIGVTCLAAIAMIVSLAPIELQRRMIDDALPEGDAELLLLLGAVYLAMILLLQLLKFIVGMTTGWLAESTSAYVRAHLWGLRSGQGSKDISSVMLTEVDALAGFAGNAPSQFIANVTMLLGALGYMFWVEPLVALAGLCLIAPQAAFTPLVQRRLNIYVSTRLRLLRRFSASLEKGADLQEAEIQSRLRNLFKARMAFLWWKFLMKATLNALNAAAPLGVILVGGWMAIEGDTTVGVIVAFVGGFSRLGDPIRQLIAFYREAAEASVRHDLLASWMKS